VGRARGAGLVRAEALQRQVCKPTGCGQLKLVTTTKPSMTLTLTGYKAGKYLARVSATNATKTGAAVTRPITLH